MFPYPNVLTSEDQSMVSMVTDPVVRLYENKIDPISFDVNETFDENLWETIKVTQIELKKNRSLS